MNLHVHFKGDFVGKLVQRLDSHYFLKKSIIPFSPSLEVIEKWQADFEAMRKERRSLARTSILSRKSRNLSQLG